MRKQIVLCFWCLTALGYASCGHNQQTKTNGKNQTLSIESLVQTYYEQDLLHFDAHGPEVSEEKYQSYLNQDGKRRIIILDSFGGKARYEFTYLDAHNFRVRYLSIQFLPVDTATLNSMGSTLHFVSDTLYAHLNHQNKPVTANSKKYETHYGELAKKYFSKGP